MLCARIRAACRVSRGDTRAGSARMRPSAALRERGGRRGGYGIGVRRPRNPASWPPRASGNRPARLVRRVGQVVGGVRNGAPRIGAARQRPAPWPGRGRRRRGDRGAVRREPCRACGVPAGGGARGTPAPWPGSTPIAVTRPPYRPVDVLAGPSGVSLSRRAPGPCSGDDAARTEKPRAAAPSAPGPSSRVSDSDRRRAGSEPVATVPGAAYPGRQAHPPSPGGLLTDHEKVSAIRSEPLDSPSTAP